LANLYKAYFFLEKGSTFLSEHKGLRISSQVTQLGHIELTGSPIGAANQSLRYSAVELEYLIAF